MMEDREVLERIEALFEENYEVLRLEGGHAITESMKQEALNQVRFYYQKMHEVANRVTDTEVKLTLPDQKTEKGRNFTIEGIVDIVREEEETWMYDIKTHQPEYIIANRELYDDQLNVYAHIWQELRGEQLDHTAIISTAYPYALKSALQAKDPFRIQVELARWQPQIEIPFTQAKVEETISDFAAVVDHIEDQEFAPAPVEVLAAKMKGTNSLFGTRVCRNCDARFSCESYREYATGKGKGERGSFKKYFQDFGMENDQEAWVNTGLQQANPDEL